MWAERGTRPRVVRQQQFNYTYIFGAVCLARDEAVGLIMPYVNMDTMAIHLEYISSKIPDGRHGVLVLDRAGWHTSERLRKFNNLTLVPLPSTSPELNPVEQVWQILKDMYLSNRCFKDEEEIVSSCCHAWNDFTNKEGAVQKLCSRDWAMML